MLYAILGLRSLTDEVLHTTFCLVENALNSRLLTPVSADPYKLNALTPNHFILGEHSTRVPSLVGNNEFSHRKRYARAQLYANAIWSRLKRTLPSKLSLVTLNFMMLISCNAYPWSI